MPVPVSVTVTAIIADYRHVGPDSGYARHSTGRDRQHSLTVHCIARIYGKVDDRILKLCPIRQGMNGLVGGVRFQNDARSNERTDHIAHVVDAGTKVEQFGCQRLSA